MKPQQRENGRELIASAIGSAMSDEDLPLLYQHLADDEEARKEFVQQILIDAELNDVFSSDNVVAALDAGVVTVTEPTPSRQTPRGRWFAVMLSLAALALTTIVIITSRQPDSGMVASDTETPMNQQADAERERVASETGPASNSPPELSEEEREALKLLASNIWSAINFAPIQAAREAARRTTSQNNIKQIALALYVFHERHGKLPALYSTDASGKPLLSWRVHLLPYLENEELYLRFRLDEPWDSEHNQALIREMPVVFRCPETAVDRFVTNYLAISSESSFLTSPAKAMFGATTPLGISTKQVSDGTSFTIAIVEVSDDRACEWTRPQDFRVVADSPLDGLGHARDPKVFLTAFGDGSTRVLSRDLDLKTFLGLTTRNGGEPVDLP